MDTALCGFRWPLLDPNDEDRASDAAHVCGLPPGHHEPHRCPNDGEQRPWPEWRPGVCRAARWHGWPLYEGAHDSHLFTYGSDPFLYVGHCGGTQ